MRHKSKKQARYLKRAISRARRQLPRPAPAVASFPLGRMLDSVTSLLRHNSLRGSLVPFRRATHPVPTYDERDGRQLADACRQAIASMRDQLFDRLFADLLKATLSRRKSLALPHPSILT